MSESLQSRVSVIIPARNEEANIECAVRSVAAQGGVPLEIIVADDQSEDRTGEILKRLKVEIPSLRTLRVDALPAGWLGKPHALACGAKIASANWLLFTDADAEHRPGSLAELLERAEEEQVDLLSLSPGQLTPTWWEKAVIPLVYVWLAKLYSFDELFRLGLMYSTGQGGAPVDYVSAHMLFNLAAMRGSVEAKVYRKELADEMASEDVAEA